MFTTLPTDIIEMAIDRAGLLTMRDLAAVGVSRTRRDTLLHRGLLLAVARGIYTVGALPPLLSPWAWFAVRSKVFALASPPDAVAGGWSAVVLHDIPTIGRPPALPSVIRAGRPPRGSDRSQRGWSRFAGVPTALIGVASGIPALTPAAAVVDVGRRVGRRAALVLADGVAFREGTTESMTEALSLLRPWPRVEHARWAVARADTDCETPLETVGRYAMLSAGLPAPRSNIWVGIGMPQYRLDHYWAERRFGLEGDGIEKYTVGDVHGALVDEKDREMEIRGWGITLGRYLWRTALRDPRSLSARCEVAMSVPPLPAHPRLEWWPSEEGFRILGMVHPRHRIRSVGWELQVAAALRTLIPRVRGSHAGFRA